MQSLFNNFNLEPTIKKVNKQKASKKIKLSDEVKIDTIQLYEESGITTKEIVKKVNNPIETEQSAEKILKSKKISLDERLSIINTNVLKVLGKQKNNVLVIRDINTFSSYISKAIDVGRIAIDTETNNSLDPITCKIMGLCLYVPGEKQAYIPINHINNETGELLKNQCTEEDIKNQLQRIEDNHVFTVFHNYKFDYKVIKCTCGIEVHCDWDTLIVAKLLDENEFSAGLKQQYISKIDPTQEKYSIDHLFENVEYAQVDPNIFALYAASDSMMTDALYLWQKPRLEATKNEPGPCGKSVYDLFKEVELPCIISTAKMELNGICFDNKFANKLRTKFETKLNIIDSQINDIINSYSNKIEEWKKDPENNKQSIVYVSASTKMSKAKIEETYKEIDENGRRFKYGKSKVSQLEDPISLSSPTQLAILLYDILKVDRNEDRSTGEEALEAINIPLTKLLLERRGIVKLLDAFINSLPEKVNHKTGKIHGSFNQYGAATGRFSSSEPNLQQIPSHMKNIRMLFTADTINHTVEIIDNYYIVPRGDEVETLTGWKKVKELVIGDTIIGNDNKEIITTIKVVDDKYLLYV